MATMIKFRAWNKLSNMMYTPTSIKLINGEVVQADIEDNSLNISDDLNTLLLEQFTGLKDVNGKDIYEGDAVQPVSSYINLKRGKPFEVKKGNYVYGKWIAKDISNKKFGVDGCYFSDEMQLIGNVHENPELLKG